MELKQFDLIQIITSKNVKYLSAVKDKVPSPHGNWSIVGFVGGDVIISRDKAIVRLPVSDVKLVGKWEPSKLF